ncbi:MAG: hypothetical protein ACRKFN_11535 [Desulfitobacterium sp.]
MQIQEKPLSQPNANPQALANLTPNQIGFMRDRAIIQSLVELGALDTNQIRFLHCPGKAGLRKAQDRLQKLYAHKALNRVPRAINQAYVYYIPPKKPQNLEHLIMLNWVYVYLLKSFERVESWSREYQGWHSFGVQPDALARINGLYYAIEVDRAESRNYFDKIEKYNSLYADHGDEVMELLNNPPKFPRVIIVTSDPKRKAKIDQLIKDNNPHGLKYMVRTLDTIVKECMT